MLVDFYIKSLQGQLFRKFKDVLMGYVPLSSLRGEHLESRSVLELVIKHISLATNQTT